MRRIAHSVFSRLSACLFACLLACLLLGAAGCSTVSSVSDTVTGAFDSDDGVDWNARVGVYTYDEAVQELGEPDACQEYADGSKSCLWEDADMFTYRDDLVLTFDYWGKLESHEQTRN